MSDPRPGTTHLCPPPGSAEMPCCGLRTYLRPDDILTTDVSKVTCRGTWERSSGQTAVGDGPEAEVVG